MNKVENELLLMDLIILGFLAASSYQLAEVFGDGSFWAWVKAICFDGAVAVMARGISKAKIANQSTFKVWIALIFLMVVSSFVNMYFEWTQYAFRKGNPEDINEAVLQMTFVDHVLAISVSGFLPIIILGLTEVRAIIAKIAIKQLEENKEEKVPKKRVRRTTKKKSEQEVEFPQTVKKSDFI